MNRIELRWLSAARGWSKASCISVVLFLILSDANAVAVKGLKNHPDQCGAAVEFEKAMDFLRNEGESAFAERDRRMMAEAIASGCNQAADRFQRVYSTLKAIGVDLGFAAKAALQLSKEADEKTHVFVEVFKRLYLESYLNLDYRSAFEQALRFAKEWRGPTDLAAKDFVKAVQYCLETLNLSQNDCLNLSITVSRSSKYFAEGSFKPFAALLDRLRNDKKYGLNIKDALKIATRIIPHGPLAPENFVKAYDYAVAPAGLNETAQYALTHALRIVSKSHRHQEPPILHE